MKNSTIKNVLVLAIVCTMLSGCISLQQPLPGSIWGNWTFEKTGFLNKQSNSQLVDYQNKCSRAGDRLHFSSDNKIKLRWYDQSCMIHEYLIGHYEVEAKVLNINLAQSNSLRDRPFPPITKFRIFQINETTLKLEEIPYGNRSRRDRTKPGFEPLIFVFKKLD